MQVRTFQGKNTQEVLAQVKAEMGSDAVILSSREFRKNNQRFYEVTAGIEREEAQTSHTSSSGNIQQNQQIPQGFADFHKDWTKFKDHVYALMQPSLNWEKISPRQRVALEYLQEEGVENDVVVELYNKLVLPEHNGSLLSALAHTVPIVSEENSFWQQHMHIMLGPYGSGKTLSALRLALLLSQQRPELKIAFINTDSSRASGRLMLRHYAELSGFESFDASDKQSFINTIKHTIDYDYVFVDFQSLAKDEKLTQRLEYFGLSQVNQNIACHLCLSPYYISAQLNHYIKQYACNIQTGIIWTKLDECVQYGAIVNIAARSGLPISALSYGAELSNSICMAEASLVWKILLKKQVPFTNLSY